jgi:hypothetical protein
VFSVTATAEANITLYTHSNTQGKVWTSGEVVSRYENWSCFEPPAQRVILKISTALTTCFRLFKGQITFENFPFLYQLVGRFRRDLGSSQFSKFFKFMT